MLQECIPDFRCIQMIGVNGRLPQVRVLVVSPARKQSTWTYNADCGEMNLHSRGAPQLMSAESVHLSANAAYQAQLQKM